MRKLTILIVDDDEGDRKQLQRLIKKSGLECICVEATTIDEAKKACKTSIFDCAIIDYKISSEDGLTAITDFHATLPLMAIIMATGHGDETIAAEAIKRGALDYIVKKNLTADLIKKSIIVAVEKFQLEKKIEEQETKLTHIAYYDYLTDIPNRLLFDHTLSKTLATAKRNKKKFVVMLLDLDRFKNVNDTLGHEAGDALLKQVALRFQSVMRTEDMLARLGGDEFGIILNDIKKIDDASLIAKKIMDCLKEPFLLGKEIVNITSSIGIAIYPVAGETGSDLLKNADKAMYLAKTLGRNNYQFYTPEDDKDMIQQLHIESALQSALKNNEFYLCYQPIYHLHDTSLFGVEVLLRWNHLEFGKVPIQKIITLAEESGFIIYLGDWIINEAFRQFKEWGLQEKNTIKLSINLSPKQLGSPNWFSTLENLIQDNRIDPRNLIFELTETDVIKNMHDVNVTLSQIAKLGAQIFIDDFGMGYSSLSLVKNLPITGLKIDQSQIQGIDQSDNDRNLVKSLFSLAENMGFMTIAEGVETETQLQFLKSFVGAKSQGYYLSKPLSADDVKVLLQKTVLSK